MTVPGARWDVGENLALASEIPDLGYDLDHLVGVDQDWTIDTSSLVQAAIDTVRDAGGGEIVVRNAGRTYIWEGLQMRSKVGIRFVGNPTIHKATATAVTHIFEFDGAESDTASLMTVDHPLPSPLTVSGASWSSGVATVTTTPVHNLLVGDEVNVLTLVPSGYNKTLAVVTAVNAGAHTFSYAVTSNPGTYSSGGYVELMPYLCHVADASGFAVDDVVMTVDDTYAALSGTAQAITALSWNSGTKIATITLAAGVAARGDAFRVSGASSSGPGSFNGVFTILSVSGATYTYKLRADPGTWSSGGTGQYVLGQTLELNRITGITGNEVRMEHALHRSYVAASNARLVKVDAVERTYLVGKVRMVIPTSTGNAGGGLWWNLAYESDCDQIDVVAPSDDGAFSIGRSAKIRLTRWGAYAGQRFQLGGFAYGVTVASSAHDIRITEGFAHKIRENNCGGGARDIVFENNQGTWIYNNFFNTHGQDCGRIRIAGNHVVLAPGQSLGFDVGDSAGLAGDFDVDILDNEVYGSGRSSIQIQGHADGTHNCRRIRVEGNRLDRPVTAHGVFAKLVDDIVIKDNVFYGDGVVGQAMVRLLDASDAEVRGNRGRGNGSDYGIYWENVDGLIVEGNSLKDFASSNLRGVTSTDVTLGPTVMDDTDVLLEGTEMLVGSESIAGALRASPPDADLTPDPVYRYHSWSISAARTINAPSSAKAAVGQRITFDITNSSGVVVTPVWDAAFVLGAPFHLKAA